MNTESSSRAPDWGTGTGSRTYGTTRWGDTGSTSKVSTQRRKVRRWWRRNRRRVQRTWRRSTQTITPTGWFVLAFTLLAIVLGASLGWIEAWFVAIAGVVLLLIALPFLIGNRAYLIRLSIDRLRVVVGGGVHLSIDIENAGVRPALPATAELPVGDSLREIAVPFIGGRGEVSIPLTIAADQRGVVEVGPITLARRDPLSLLRREVTWRDRHLVHVHPQTVALPPGSAGLVRDLEGAASRRLTDSDLSFHAVREYVHGDALRHVHWKSTAKTGTLMVRQYEESQTARTAVLFDANRAEYGSDEEFELGVSVAASLALQAVREGRERYIASAWNPGRMRASIDGLEEIPSDTTQQLLDGWAELEAAEEARPIEALARALADSRRPLSVVTLVTGSNVDPNRLRRAAVAFPPDVAVIAIRCEQLADPAAHFIDSTWMLTIGQLGDLPQLQMRRGKA
ncbi:DUF58 domain-containing protein [Leucobacter denitrificans]|uniref:DUF58 domain-containing protein n=1 Tax=Leucobacter denitrificans TaxID=683042 RepID=A0A7G9S3A4_9MICO|nr:DUF58 domain-containing protein [Leucobacter denitrificans]QNN62329.1 DUF58 domain-containing protein [Leucobacter denitrificans]